MCDCVSRVNEGLKADNTRIALSVSIVNQSLVERLSIETELVEKRRVGKKPVRLFASYCPFCGEKLAALPVSPP